jgi:hypothetical protein
MASPEKYTADGVPGWCLQRSLLLSAERPRIPVNLTPVQQGMGGSHIRPNAPNTSLVRTTYALVVLINIGNHIHACQSLSQ